MVRVRRGAAKARKLHAPVHTSEIRVIGIAAVTTSASTRPGADRTLVDPSVSVKVRLAGLRAAMMLLYVYADILSLFRPSQIAEIESGEIGPFDVSRSSLVIASLIVILPALMIALSLTLRASINRPAQSRVRPAVHARQRQQPPRRELGLLLPVRPSRDRAYVDDRRDRLELAPARLVRGRSIDTSALRQSYEQVPDKQEAEAMTEHKIGSREEWQAAREELLQREKEHTRMGDELARQRRELPWVPVEKEYWLETDEGTRALPELFEGRSQLLVYHFMFGPSYEAGCPTCSSMADTVDGALPHLHARDVAMMYVSQAPLEKLQAYKRRMGWNMPWVSSAGSDFNFDLGYSRTEEQTREAIAPMLEAGPPPIVDHNANSSGTDVTGYLTQGSGFSAFVLDDGTVYQTYATTGRGVEFLMGYYGILDRAPKGRDEGDAFQMWIRRHDEYDQD
jgi:predicted dithiol-disulfide oxidoreductase (DUF899 family)